MRQRLIRDECFAAAVYGGWFIALSYVWGQVIDGVRPDRGTRQPPLRPDSYERLPHLAVASTPTL